MVRAGVWMFQGWKVDERTRREGWREGRRMIKR